MRSRWKIRRNVAAPFQGGNNVMKKFLLASLIAFMLYVGKTTIDAVDHAVAVRNAAITEVLR